MWNVNVFNCYMNGAVSALLICNLCMCDYYEMLYESRIVGCLRKVFRNPDPSPLLHLGAVNLTGRH